jgi:hypothetical protein
VGTRFDEGADGLEVHPAGEGLGKVESAPPDQAVLWWSKVNEEEGWWRR